MARRQDTNRQKTAPRTASLSLLRILSHLWRIQVPGVTARALLQVLSVTSCMDGSCRVGADVCKCDKRALKSLRRIQPAESIIEIKLKINEEITSNSHTSEHPEILENVGYKNSAKSAVFRLFTAYRDSEGKTIRYCTLLITIWNQANVHCTFKSWRVARFVYRTTSKN